VVIVKTKLWLSLPCGAVGAALTATVLAANYLDDSNVNDGKWSARIDGDAKTARQGRVVIDNFGGQWLETGPKRAGDPCRGTKPFPITVQKSDPKVVEFSVWAEQVSKCADFALTLDVVDERTLVGKTSDGREVRLTREPGQRKTQR
jgi:hypothetical protein